MTILSAVDSGAFASLLTQESVRAAAEQDALRLLEIETKVEAGAKSGFGVAALTAATSGAVCQIVDEDREAHEALLKRQAARIAEELRRTRASP